MLAGEIRRQNRQQLAENAAQRQAERQDFLDNSVQTRRGRRRVSDNNQVGSATSGSVNSSTPTNDSSPLGDLVNLGSEALGNIVEAPKSLLGSLLDGLADAFDFGGDSDSEEGEQSASPSSSNEIQAQQGDTLSQLLAGRGYSASQLYGKDENGSSLLDRMAQANGLSDPDSIQAGQTLNLSSPDSTSSTPVNSGTARRQRRAEQAEAGAARRAEAAANQPEKVLTRRGYRTVSA